MIYIWIICTYQYSITQLTFRKDSLLHHPLNLILMNINGGFQSHLQLLATISTKLFLKYGWKKASMNWLLKSYPIKIKQLSSIYNKQVEYTDLCVGRNSGILLYQYKNNIFHLLYVTNFRVLSSHLWWEKLEIDH